MMEPSNNPRLELFSNQLLPYKMNPLFTSTLSTLYATSSTLGSNFAIERFLKTYGTICTDIKIEPIYAILDELKRVAFSGSQETLDLSSHNLGSKVRSSIGIDNRSLLNDFLLFYRLGQFCNSGSNKG